MNRIFKSFFALATIFVLALAACSDDPDGGIQKDYEVNESYTDLLQQAWKITEHEYADKSYYTRDFKTSWVINKPFSYNGRVYRTFNYKLSLQTEINYVEEVEVGTFPDGEDWIVDLKDGSRLFAIEDLHYGGNKYVMIIRDRQGNRFRCETVANDCIYFVENATDYNTLKVEYVRTINAYGNTVADIDYTVAALPRNLIGAYAVLVEGGATGIELKLTASNGNAKLLTSNGLGSGWCRGEITSYDLPGEDPEQPDFDTETAEALFGVWIEDERHLSFLNYLNINGKPTFSYCIQSSTRFIQTYDFEIKIKDYPDGSKWAVFQKNATDFQELFEIADFIPQKSMKIRRLGDTVWTTLRYIPDGKCFVIKNVSSYEELRITYLSLSDNNGKEIALDSYTRDYKSNEYCGVLSIDGSVFRSYTVKAKIEACKRAGYEPAFEFEYSKTVPAGAPALTCIEISDDDFPASLNAADMAKLESKLWSAKEPAAWRIDKFKPNSNYDFIDISQNYGWLITERLYNLHQGLHIGGNVSFKADDNYLLKDIGGKLYLTDWNQNKPKIEILTPIDVILNSDVMDIREEGDDRIYRCTYCATPLVVFTMINAEVAHSGSPVEVLKYEITETNSSGSVVSQRTITNDYFIRTLGYDNLEAAWCLAADETLNPDQGRYTISQFIYWNGSVRKYTKSQQQLGDYTLFYFTGN
ncbi:MAG: hypothetical protein K2K22_09770 [Muribaculaceae bacterium]|nr:hypothetical protein [Muribaculaceae bacterium]